MHSVPREIYTELSKLFTVDSEAFAVSEDTSLIASGDIECSDPEYFAGGHAWSDGTIFRYRSHYQDILIKICPRNNSDLFATTRIEERLRYMHYLRTNGLAIILPILSSQQHFVESSTDASYFAYAWKMIQGKNPAIASPFELASFYQNWGKLIGKMHYLAKSYPDWTHSPMHDQEANPILGWQSEWQHFYHWIPDADVKEAWIEIRKALEKLPTSRENFGFVHNDPHPGNIIDSDGTLVLIDFDVANYHWFILEIAICIYSEYSRVQFHSPFANQLPYLEELFLRPFMQGYRSENHLPAPEFEQIELFLNYRRCLMFTVFYDQIKENAPHVLTELKHKIISFQPFLPMNTIL